VVGLGAAALASVVDVREQRLPDVVVIPATVAVMALVVAGGAGEDSWPRTWACLGTGALAGVLFVGVCFVAPTQLGLGDAKLAVLLALTTSWLSPTTTLWAFISGLVFAGLWAAVMLLRGRGGRAGLPLGPFLTLGAVISVVAAIG
jgi:leader peptidase (prepilin peptidase)/N-methyltransferase